MLLELYVGCCYGCIGALLRLECKVLGLVRKVLLGWVGVWGNIGVGVFGVEVAINCNYRDDDLIALNDMQWYSHVN